MEDAVKVVPGLEVGGLENHFDFFAVYSGRRGAAVCQSGMHLAVAMEAEKKELCRGWEYWNRVMSSSFQEMEDEIRGAEEADGGGGGKSGRWTAVVVMVGKEEIVVANDTIAGDCCCRAVLYSGGVALPLSSSSSSSGGRRRRRESNQKVKSLYSSLSSKCKGRNRENGFLRHPHVKFGPIMKRIRSLRRHLPKPVPERDRMRGKDLSWNLNRDIVGVIGEPGDDDNHGVKPEVTVRERGESSSSEEFVVIGSKGLWDVVYNELACDIVAECFNGGMRMRFADDTTENCAPAAAAFLAELAMARGSRENVSVIVVKL